MHRNDDFKIRRSHLENLTEEELEKRFWYLTEKIIDPIIELARTHTSPSIERSVLLRMGFDSLTAKEIVNRCVANGLLGKGAGHIVLKFSLLKKISLKEAGEMLARGKGWDVIDSALKINISDCCYDPKRASGR
ncbi:MAG: ornithine aminomutase [Thermoanaerobacterales bacterium]|nr:ornithine aminomutase [Thermoanaerobacterales bacterium]